MQTGMKPLKIEKPAEGEFNEYYSKYISLVPETELVDVLASQAEDVTAVFDAFGDERGNFAYAEGKWTVKEVFSHLIDGERHFAYRLHRIARGDATPIEGFEQDGYIENSHAGQRTIGDLAAEFSELRSANVRQLRVLDEADWKRMGTASGFPVSARALGYIMAGHVRHHLGILSERYVAAGEDRK
ncbi:MAG: DinB family protein [Pyrinomonadaceae bacterium]